jgi:hypothetical protein
MEVKLKNGSVSGDDIKTMPLIEWLSEGVRLFGEDKKQWKFVCSHCKHVQSIGDFIELRKLKISEVNPETAYMSCIGRFDTRIKDVGTLSDKKQPCNYTLGGLFCFAKTYVVTDSGENIPVFEFAQRQTETEVSGAKALRTPPTTEVVGIRAGDIL